MTLIYINIMNLTDFNFCNRGFFKFSREGVKQKAHSKVERSGTLRGLVAESPTWSFCGGARPKKRPLTK